MMTTDLKRQILLAYEHDVETNTSLVERVWGGVLVAAMVASVGLGWFLHNVPLPVETIEQKVEMIRTRMVIEEKKKPAPVIKKKVEVEKPKVVTDEKPVDTKPIDLTNKPVLDQKMDDTEEKAPPGTPVVRRVYGLRKVYSVGLGAQGGSGGDAVIGKLGNTLNTAVDTFTATKKELKGALVSITSVSKTAGVIKVVKPEYTKEMIENRVSGVIKARILIDIDGKVKDVQILNDLGFGSGDRAKEAIFQWVFEPALVGSTPAAVWQLISIRFVLQEG